MARMCRRPSQDVYCDIVDAIKKLKEDGTMTGTINKLRVLLSKEVGCEISEGTVRRAAAKASVPISDSVKRKVGSAGAPHVMMAANNTRRIESLEERLEALGNAFVKLCARLGESDGEIGRGILSECVDHDADPDF